MAGTVLFVLNHGFDDMAFLTNQVILEEAGNDIILASLNNDTIKGQDTSIMTVSLDEAIKQQVDYSALIIIGGQELQNWQLLKDVILEFHQSGKIIGVLGSAISLVKEIFGDVDYSTNSSVVASQQIYSLFDLDNVEEFATTLASKI